jgi:hypothetical protein
MRNIVLTLAAGLCLLAAGPLPSRGAELPFRENRGAPVREAAGHNCWRERVCGPMGCQWHRQCWSGCQGGRESRWTCGSLHGAYGPYGGRGYWDAYTMGY